ncbi:MAG: phosphate ABC transporter permease subunit PstC [Phycisphaeraceae bacterium]|nr:phosphate ABC transporter permease subunit PstC [Phycisphaeraceae bacterium]
MTSSGPSTSSPWRTDAALAWILRVLAALACAVVLLILVFLVIESMPALRRIGPIRLLRDGSWHPLSDLYGMTPMIAASVLVTLGAIVLATPLGIGSALFCRYYAPGPIARAYRRLVELLAGIPSVVYGFWGLVVLVPIVTHSLLAGVVILALMVLPTVALISDASLANVPQSYVQGGAALGLSRWSLVRRVILPAARPGLLTAVILATARAIGETMAVLMVCGNVVQMPRSLTDPVRTLTANIALEMSYAADTHRSALFVSGLLLMGIVGVLVVIADRVGGGRMHV